MEWGVYDVNVDYYDHGSPTYEELDGHDAEYYVDRYDEAEFLKGVINGIRRQRKDPMFADHCTDDYAKQCIERIKAKIRALKQ